MQIEKTHINIQSVNHASSHQALMTLYRPILMTPACTSFWILERMLGFFKCSCRAAGSSLAC